MKPISLLVSVCVLAVSWSAHGAAEKPSDPKSVAAGYFEALITGDLKRANALSAVPFSLDRKQVLMTRAEVEAVHERIAADKGERPLPKYTIAKTDKAPNLDAKTFPNYAVYRVEIDGEFIDIYVSSGDEPKVIGFSD